MKKLFSLIIVTLLASTVAWAHNVYVKVTSEEQLFNPQKTYILVSESQNTSTSGVTTLYVNVAGAFSSSFTRQNISHKEGVATKYYLSDNHKVIDVISATQEKVLTNVCELTLNGSKTQCTIALPESYNDDTGATKYVARATSATSNNMTSTTDATLDRAQWRIVEDEDGEGFVVYSNQATATDRLIAQTSYSSKFFCVKESTANIFKAHLYVLDESILEASPAELDLGKNLKGTFVVNGRNLLKDAMIITTRNGNGFTADPIRTLPITDNAINNGVVTVYYTGTDENATGFVEVKIGIKRDTTNAVSIKVPVTAQAANRPNIFKLVKSSSELVKDKKVILAFQEGPFVSGTTTYGNNYAAGKLNIYNNTDNFTNGRFFDAVWARPGHNYSGVDATSIEFVQGEINISELENYHQTSDGFSDVVTLFTLDTNEYGYMFRATSNGITGFLSFDPKDKNSTNVGLRNYGYLNNTTSYNYLSEFFDTEDKIKKCSWTVEEDLDDEGTVLGLIIKNVYNPDYTLKYSSKNIGASNITSTNPNAYLYVEKPEPFLGVSTIALNLPKETGTGTFIVTGDGLTEDVTLSFNEGATEGLRIEPQTLTKEAVMDGGAQVTVYYEGNSHEASGTITVTSSGKTVIVKVTAESSAEWTTIYIPKSAGDYYIWAWDANGTIPGQSHNYFENWPGKKINELETANLGNNGGNTAGVEFYTFEYADNATGLGLVFTESADGPQTATITPRNHEIYYYAGGTECPTGIPMDEVIFPDETFLKYIKSTKFKSRSGELYDKPYEYNGYSNVTEILEPEELANIDFMRINTETVGSLYSFKGLEYLKNLKEVSLTADGQFNLVVPELDLSMSPSLEKLHINSAPNLTSLKLPDGTLKELELSDCDALPVGNLNQKLATYENLEKLTIENCDLINSLNVEQNYNLTYLYLRAQPIPTLSLDNNSKLEELHLLSTNIGNDNLNANLAKHEDLRVLTLSGNDNLTSTTLDLSKHTELNRLYIMHQHSFETFDLTNNTKINYMVMSGNNNLASLTIPKEAMQNMEHLWIERNKKLMLDAIDLTGNTSLKQISVNFNGKPSTITGVGNQMTGLRYISTEHQLYNGNVLELEGLQEFYHLDVLGCGLDRLNVKNCKALGDVYYRNQETENAELIKRNSNTQIFIADNYLRSLDLTGTYLPYNYNVTGSEKEITNADGEVSYTVVDDPLFSPENYMRHYSYNGQITPELTPNVALVYHDRWAETPNYTYLVYFRLEQNPNDCYPADYEVDPSMAGEKVLTLNGLFNKEAASRGSDVDNVGFDYQRVKLWSRFSQTQEGPVLDVHGTNEIHALTGVASPTWDENTTTDLSHVDPTHVLGKILSLGMYTVPCGHDRRYHETSGAEGTTAYVEPAYVGGTVSYFYSTLNWTKEPEVTPDGPSPMPQRDGGTGEDLDVYAPYNGDAITSETDYYKGITVKNNAVVEKYDNAIPFKFDWKVELTNDPESIVTAIKGIHGDLPALIEEIQYYNVMGQMSSTPWQGVNIVVTRYSDGTTTTQKVIR